MPNIDEFALYLASWEHLYLLPKGLPGGLPNQLFSQHPWALILFEQIYCYENGLRAEQTAADELKWINSELFVRLSSAKYDIIKPLHLKSFLRPHIDDVIKEFDETHGRTIYEAIQEAKIEVVELFEWRLKLLQPFLDQNRLVLYDWSVAPHERAIPVGLQKAVNDVLRLEIAPIPLTKDLRTELSPERARIFHALQDLEREPLRQCRMGQMSEREFLEIVKARWQDYREIDIELVADVEPNLERILRLRERFGGRGGWKLVRDYLAAFERAAHPSELQEIESALRDRLRYCFKPMLAEYGGAFATIARGAVSLLPFIGPVVTLAGMKQPMYEIAKVMSEQVMFFRGETRHRNK